MTALERLRELSGLSGVTTFAALQSLTGGTGPAGALLVASSGLGTTTSWIHLFADRAGRHVDFLICARRRGRR